jgi:hypothetical protein
VISTEHDVLKFEFKLPDKSEFTEKFVHHIMTVFTYKQITQDTLSALEIYANRLMVRCAQEYGLRHITPDKFRFEAVPVHDTVTLVPHLTAKVAGTIQPIVSGGHIVRCDGAVAQNANWTWLDALNALCLMITNYSDREQKHEYYPGDPTYGDRCGQCGQIPDHIDHKDIDGSNYYDTDTYIDRMRADGSIAPKMNYPATPEVSDWERKILREISTCEKATLRGLQHQATHWLDITLTSLRATLEILIGKGLVETSGGDEFAPTYYNLTELGTKMLNLGSLEPMKLEAVTCDLSKERMCWAMESVVQNNPFGSVVDAKGLSMFKPYNSRTGEFRFAAIIYKTKARDKGLALNFCPFCGAKLFKEDGDV